MWWIPILWLAGCSPTAPAPEAPDAPPAAAASDPASVAEPPLAAAPTGRYAARHVLVAWAGAVDAPPTVTRTREEARALAEALRARAEAGEPLDELARVHSDGPSAPRGGDLGVFRAGTLVPAFEAAVASVPVGALAPVVETPWGFHVARREPVVEAHLAHLVITHADAWRSRSARTPAEARARIEAAQRELEGGAAWEEVVARYSEDATAPFGGDLGTVPAGQLIPAVEAAGFALAPGAVSGIVESPYGLHLVRRVD